MQATALHETAAQDLIAGEKEYRFFTDAASGIHKAVFFAFNTVVSLQAIAEEARCRKAFENVRERCRRYERLFSRTLPHSDISLLNCACGKKVTVSRETYELIRASLSYCAASEGLFDITIDAVGRLWDFHVGIIPDQEAIDKAIRHINWQTVHLETDGDMHRAWLADPKASIDLGGIAKGYIADSLSELLSREGIESFIINAGGNVIAQGMKLVAGGERPWRIGIQDPKNPRATLESIALCNASAVTSGIYERCFTKDGTFYHHVLDPKSGYPVETDIAGVTVVARRSLDAEGFSTTLLALGSEKGKAFAQKRPEIFAAFFVDRDNHVTKVS